MQSEDNLHDLKIINMDEVEIREVSWLWKPYISYGNITILKGEPGNGKTTLMLNLIAALTTGIKLPFSESQNKPINIIYQTAEDSLAETIKPRLVAAKCDCSRVKVIDDSDKALSFLDSRIEQALEETRARLIVLDPLQAFLGGRNCNMNLASEVRPLMKRLANIGEKYSCAILLVGHLNKGAGTAGQRLLGSTDFHAAARSSLLLCRSSEDPQVRILAQDKNSLEKEGDTITFRIDEDGFTWGEKVEISADELLLGGYRENKVQVAEKLLLDILKNGEVEQKRVWNRAQSLGVSKRTLEQAKSNLKVKSKKSGKNWSWSLA